MKMWIKMLVVVLPLLAVMGCEPWFAQKDDPAYTFINKSSYTVTVIPKSSGWNGFRIAPGEQKKVYDQEDVFFSYEPVFRVAVGVNESTRVIFVDVGGEQVSK